MRTMLAAGAFCNLLNEYELDIVNSEPLTLGRIVSFCQQAQLRYEQILITDDGMAGMDRYAVESALASLTLMQERENRVLPVLIMTTRISLRDVSVAGVTVQVHDAARIPIHAYLDAVLGKGAAAAVKKSRERQPDKEKPSMPPKKSIVQKFRRGITPEEAPSAADKEFETISREVSRVVAVTGHRGSGVTSTAVNLAHIANNRNISTILIDMDTVNCSFNLYFNEFYELAEKDQDIAHSLIRNLAKPQSYSVNSYRSNNLYVVALAYSFSDKALLERFFTPEKFINMITTFRKDFQLCLLDIPLDALIKLKPSIMYIDCFGLCVSNNLYSMTSTLRGIQHDFKQDEMELLFGKSKVIVSKYNEMISIQDEFFSPDKVCDLLLELSEVPIGRTFELAGQIPYRMDFDSQLEMDIPIAANDASMEKAYSDILLRMIKGAI